MSFFGEDYPKFIANVDSTQDEILLEHCIILKDEPDPDLYVVRSVKTGKRTFTNAGRHWIFKVKVLLWKYDNPATKYLSLKSFEGSSVWLYRRSDGETFYSSFLDKIKFTLVSANESYFDDYKKQDCLTLTFMSEDRIDGSTEFGGYVTLTEDFTGNTYDNTKWTNSLLIEDEVVKGCSGWCVAGCGDYGEIYTYAQAWFIASVVSSNDSHILFTCDAHGGSGFGSYIMLMCRANRNYLFGITLIDGSNVRVACYKADTSYPDFEVNVQTTIPTDQWNSYKILYNRKTNSIYFYVKLNRTGNWIAINEEPLILTGMDSQKFAIGIGCRGAFSFSGTKPSADNLSIFYKPDGA